MRAYALVGAVLIGLSLQQGWAQQPAPVSVAEGASVTVDLPFAVTQFAVADRAVLTVNLLGDRKAALQGLKAGVTTATFTGAGGESFVQEVRVQTDVGELMAALRVALEEIPEVETARAGDRVVIRGRVSNLASWGQIERVTAAFGPQVLNLATLEMPPEILVNLREDLRGGGFQIAENAAEVGEKAPGVLAVGGSGKTVTVSGCVYSPEQLARIKAIIGAQRAMQLEGAEGAAVPGADEKYTAVVNVTIVPLIVEVDLAFITISEEDLEKVGVNLFDAGLLTIDAVGELTAGSVNALTKASGWTETDGVKTQTPNTRSRTRDSGYGRYLMGSDGGPARLGSSLAGTLNFFTGENPGRLLHRGQIHFRNGAEEWRELHSGGTLKVRVISEREAKIEDIDYGFMLKVKGGLKDAEAAALDLDFELSVPERIPETPDYDLKRERVVTAVDCAVGQTMVIGGVNKLLEDVDVRATPILRSIPLLKPFFSERASQRTDQRMLMLVSAHIVRELGPSAPLSEGNAEVIEIGDQPAQERLEKKRPRRFFFF